LKILIEEKLGRRTTFLFIDPTLIADKMSTEELDVYIELWDSTSEAYIDILKSPALEHRNLSFSLFQTKINAIINQLTK